MVDLETAANIAQIYQAVGPLILGGVAGVFGAGTYLRFFRKKEHRLFANWKRPIAVVPSPEYPMTGELQLLKRTAFLDNVEMLAADGTSASLISERHRLVVLRYEKESPYFWDVYEQMAFKQIPVIIYAEQGAINLKDFPRIQKNLYHTICNTPVRLLSDVAAIMATYPSAKELK